MVDWKTVVAITLGAVAIAAPVACEHATPVGDGDADSDGDVDAALDGSADGDAEPDGDSPCLPDPDGDADGDADADLGGDGDGDGDGETDAEGAESDEDGDGWPWLDGDVDLASCPPDMVEAGPICIDRYEASRSDATALDQGTAVDVARSVRGVLPWLVNPMTVEALASFEAACAAAGKRLCRPAEWEAACHGPSGTAYAFGDTFDREACNCVDTFCDDYCAAHPEVDPCSLASDCGYAHGCYHQLPTGSMPDCVGEVGAFDLNGNAWEVVAPSTTDPRGYEVRGGAFNCASAATRLRCDFDAGWTSLYAGFRCCLDR